VEVASGVGRVRGLVRWVTGLAAAWIVIVSVVYFAPALRFLASPGVFRPLASGWRAPPWPYFGQAMGDALSAVIAAALLAMAAWGVGRGLARLLGIRFDAPLAGLASHISLGIGAFGLLGIGLATAGWYRAPGLRAIAMAAALLAAVQWWRTSVPGSRLPPRVHLPAHRRIEWLIALYVAAVTLLGALAPEAEYDALWFHLYFPRLALETGHLVDVPTEYVSLYPMGWGLWYGWGLAFGGDTVAKLQHWIMLPVIAGMVVTLGRRMMPRLPAATAVFAWVTIPLVVWSATTAYIDLGQTLHVTCAVYALLRYRDDGHLRWIALGGLQLGAAMAAKHLALVAGLLLGAWVVVVAWRRTASLPATARAALLFGAVALLLPLPWYVRAWLASGNPVHPELFSIFGSPAERWTAVSDAGLQRFMDRFGRPRTVANVLTLPWDMTMHAARYGGTLGLGVLVLAPLALLLRGHGLRRTGENAVMLFVVAFVAIWASPVAAYQVRWLSPVLAALAMLMALGIHRFERVAGVAWGTAGATAARVVVLAIGVLHLPPLTPLHERDRVGWTGWLTHVAREVPLVALGTEDRSTHMNRRLPTAAAWQAARAIVRPEDVVLALSGGDQFYSVGRYLNPMAPLISESAFERGCAPDRASAFLTSLGVRFVVIDRQYLRINGFTQDYEWEGLNLTCAVTVRALYRPRHDDGRVVIYEVSPR
jgi:hypothetical protein